MMRWIVGSSLKFRFIVVALASATMFFGVQQANDAAVDVFPEFAPPKVEVHTIAIGLAPTEVEQLITIPLEQALNGIPGVETIRSNSVEQLSQIVLLFEQGTDLLEARQLVGERIASVTPTLPTWAAPPVMLQPLSATSRVLKIGLTATDPELDLMDLSMTAYWKIRSRSARSSAPGWWPTTAGASRVGRPRSARSASPRRSAPPRAAAPPAGRFPGRRAARSATAARPTWSGSC